jgi:LAO/AO transport system kinase
VNGLLDRFHRGERHALARLLSHVENQTELGVQALRALSGSARGTHVIGLTGPPGAGKSTLANSLIQSYRDIGKSIAVLAIDPTSPISGGATLGDRVRMLEKQDDPAVYIRSMASRGQLGGLALAAFGAATVLDKFGFDVILVETVGTGQDEVDIASLADTVVVVQTPAQGDAVQVAKAGILEIADLFVVNKADLQGASELARELRQMVHYSAGGVWTIPVLQVSSTEQRGITELRDAMIDHFRVATESSELTARRARRNRYHAKMIALAEVRRWLDRAETHEPEPTNPSECATHLLDEFARSRSST